MGSDVTYDALINSAVTKYHNMVKQDRWKLTEPKDSKIVALTTQVTNLEKRLVVSEGKAVQPPPSTTNPKFNCALPAVQMKYDGPKKMINGEQWWWCEHHMMEGVYDGLYVKHPPDEHDDWLERKKGGKRGKRDKQISGRLHSNGFVKDCQAHFE